MKRSRRGAEHLARGAQRPLGMVALLERRTEHGHDAVAHVRDQRPAGAENRLGHLVEVRVDDVDHDGGGLFLGEAREAAQVGEQHRAVALDRAEAQVLAGARDDLLDDVGRHEAREQAVHALTFDRLDEIQDRERPEQREREREQRIDEADDQAAVEGDLRGDREDDRRGE